MKKQITTLLALCIASSASAKITLSPLFSDNMILQQQTQAPIWGQSSETESTVKITTSWNNKTTKTKSDTDGNWRIELETPSYGGPYTITINDGNKHTISNVLIGEVWIASGQSNMEMEMEGFNSQHVENSNLEIARSTDNLFRVMDVERTVSKTPVSTPNSKGWCEASPESIAPFSAAAYYFGRTMRECLDIPVGVLVSSWGGTTINSWAHPDDVRTYEDVINATRKPSPRSQHYPGGLYNGMINPIAGYAAKGFLWYQGEADRMRHNTYEDKLSDLVGRFRTAWGKEDMPFYYAQIAPFEYAKNIKSDTLNAPRMRDAMAKAVDRIPNSAIVILSDAGLRMCIHPSNKKVVGERFAYQALAKCYGIKGIVADGPVYESKQSANGNLVLTFKNAERGLTTFNQPLTDFEVAGKDGRYYPASARVRGNTVIVGCKEVKEPINARYGYTNWFKGTLFNIAGLPASTFCTE